MTTYQPPKLDPKPSKDPQLGVNPKLNMATNGRQISASKKVDDISKHESKYDPKYDPKHDPKHDSKHDSKQKPEDGTKPGTNKNPGGKPMPGDEKR